MDHQRFDTLTRLLGAGAGRRKLIGGLSAVLLAGLATPEPALACKKVGKKCDKNKDCCDGAKCKGDKKDKKGKCTCKNGFTKCDRICCPKGNDCVSGDCCVSLTPAFQRPAASCTSSDECCAGGTCCTFTDVDGDYSGCYDLLSRETTCGTSCETIVNCFGGQCIDGVCHEE